MDTRLQQQHFGKFKKWLFRIYNKILYKNALKRTIFEVEVNSKQKFNHLSPIDTSKVAFTFLFCLAAATKFWGSVFALTKSILLVRKFLSYDTRN